MAIILKRNFVEKKLFDKISVRTLVLSAIFAVFAVLILAGSSFSLLRSALSEQKKHELSSVASTLAKDAQYKNFTIQNAEISPHIKRRVFVVDRNFRITYDSSTTNNLTGKFFLHPTAEQSLRNISFFDCRFLSGSIECCIAIPIKSDGEVSESLILLESDASHHRIFNTMGVALTLSALVIIALFIALAAFVSSLLKQRLASLLHSIKTSRTEFSAETLPIILHDETEPLIKEFNDIYEQINYVQQMRKAFVSDASHELRTPLAAIKLLCESIAGTENIDPETTQEFMEDILLEVDRMSHTANKLLILSRLDNSATSHLAPVHLTDIVKNSIITLSPLASDKEITIESYLEDNCTILADTEGATQIVSNLIDNAIKYNNIGGYLRIYLYSKNGSCIFIVDDTGIGIPEEYRETVFDRFFRVDKSRKHDGRGGSGLGLAIVKQNILRFSGSIKITDSVFGGARFTVTLPKLTTTEEDL